MFTGIIETAAPVLKADRGEGGLRLELDLSAFSDPLVMGESVAVNGACLTVADLNGGVAAFDAGDETLSLTTLGSLKSGDTVNVERALKMGDRLGGHMVTGHVDGVGHIVDIQPAEDQTTMVFEVPSNIFPFTLHKGSITIDGVSLTLTSRIEGQCTVSVALIPHTLLVTTLGRRQIGDAVNVEADQVGKWICQMVATGQVKE